MHHYKVILLLLKAVNFDFHYFLLVEWVEGYSYYALFFACLYASAYELRDFKYLEYLN